MLNFFVIEIFRWFSIYLRVSCYFNIFVVGFLLFFVFNFYVLKECNIWIDICFLIMYYKVLLI